MKMDIFIENSMHVYFKKEKLLLSLYCYEEEKHFFHHKSIITLKRSYGFIRLGETIGYLLHQNANHRSYKFNDFEKHLDICCTKMQTSIIDLTQKFRKKVRNTICCLQNSEG